MINIANTSSYTLSGSCSENGRNVTLTLDSITTTSPCTSGSYSKIFSTASAVDGTISLDISQTDLAGNTGTISSSIIKDTGVPTVGIDTLPLIQATTATGYLVTGLCSENTRLVSLSVTDGVLTRSANITCTGGIYSGSMDVSSLSESLITFTATLEDRVGNAATPSVRYTSKDTVYPGLSLTATSPVNIANVNLLPFSGLCSENTQTILLMAGSQSGSIACTFGSFSGALDLSSLPDGNMTLTGSHRDTAGNTTLRAITLIKDTIRPSISLMSLSSTGVTQSGSIMISLGGSESLL